MPAKIDSTFLPASSCASRGADSLVPPRSIYGCKRASFSTSKRRAKLISARRRKMCVASASSASAQKTLLKRMREFARLIDRRRQKEFRRFQFNYEPQFRCLPHLHEYNRPKSTNRPMPSFQDANKRQKEKVKMMAAVCIQLESESQTETGGLQRAKHSAQARAHRCSLLSLHAKQKKVGSLRAHSRAQPRGAHSRRSRMRARARFKRSDSGRQKNKKITRVARSGRARA